MIYERLGISLENPEIISIVGAGGKTSLLNGLAQELKSLGKKVLSTTSTRIFKPSNMDYFFLGEIPEDFIPRSGTITCYGDHVKGGKLIGVNMEHINKIINRHIFDYVLIEADGANHKPFKAPALHEPVISQASTKTIGVIGLDSIGRVLNESDFHRPKLISELIEKEFGEVVVVDDIIKVVLHQDGTFKSSVGEKILVLNKVNSAMRLKEANKIRDRLHYANIRVLICNIISKEFY